MVIKVSRHGGRESVNTNNITPDVNGSINRSASQFGSKASKENLRKRDCSKRKKERKRKQKGEERKEKREKRKKKKVRKKEV